MHTCDKIIIVGSYSGVCGSYFYMRPVLHPCSWFFSFFALATYRTIFLAMMVKTGVFPPTCLSPSFRVSLVISVFPAVALGTPRFLRRLVKVHHALDAVLGLEHPLRELLGPALFLVVVVVLDRLFL
jgi:hypothetical protein